MHPQPVTDAQMKMNYNHTVADAVQFEYRTEVVAVAHDATARAEAVNLKKYVAFDMAAQQYNTITNGGVEPWTGCARRSSRGTRRLPIPLAQASMSMQPGSVSEPIRGGTPMRP